jgi:hypothetical protein
VLGMTRMFDGVWDQDASGQHTPPIVAGLIGLRVVGAWMLPGKILFVRLEGRQILRVGVMQVVVGPPALSVEHGQEKQGATFAFLDQYPQPRQMGLLRGMKFSGFDSSVLMFDAENGETFGVKMRGDGIEFVRALPKAASV